MSQKKSTDVKSRILTAALFLFNRFGFVSVRLQHIADEAGVSVGNLAYHVQTKHELIETLYETIVTEQRQLLTDLRLIPLFASINHHLGRTFELHQQYSFFFTDTLEVIRAYPAIKRRHREQLQWQAMQLEWLFSFSVARGALQPPTPPDSSGLLAHRYLMLTETWLSFERLRGTDPGSIRVADFRQAVWALLAPSFTLTGKDEYRHTVGPSDQSGETA